MITDLSVRAKAVKLLEEKIGENLYHFGIGRLFRQVTKSMKHKRKK